MFGYAYITAAMISVQEFLLEDRPHGWKMDSVRQSSMQVLANSNQNPLENLIFAVRESTVMCVTRLI